ncbi:hypothetical protein [Yinghuangia soli]|uniref:DUF3592 domain-containing protein n=1 Tax=Yinghuangia soli TaxID=2908204 RepID=A0AA41PVC4_9ACTN|nr:hypothetical protein [Yinghuangia soli]MCF2526553.1 hypothetical protein [Yinghuangia soli]
MTSRPSDAAGAPQHPGRVDPAAFKGPGAMARGLATGITLGGGITCLIMAGVGSGGGTAAATGAALLAVNLVWFMVGTKRRRRIQGPRPEPVLALARIESRKALSSETGDIPVEFDLTVAPDEGPAFRVSLTQPINLVDIPDYRVGGIIVVRFRPTEAWGAKIITAPDAYWAERAATEAVDSAPESTKAKVPLDGCGFCAVAFVGMLAGSAGGILLFH